MEKKYMGNNPMNINISDIFSPQRKTHLLDQINSFGEEGNPLVEIMDNITDNEGQ
jgi:hypothetical protein